MWIRRLEFETSDHCLFEKKNFQQNYKSFFFEIPVQLFRVYGNDEKEKTESHSCSLLQVQDRKLAFYFRLRIENVLSTPGSG